MNGFFNFRKLVVGVMAATCFMGFQSCLDDDDDYPYSKVLPNALVTVKPVDDGSYFLQLDDSTTLLPVNMTSSPFGQKEVRALVNFDETNESSGIYSKAVNINWIDSILTKPIAPDDLVTIAEDGYLTLRFRTIWGDRNKAHFVNLLTGKDPENPYEVEFRHNAYGDVYGAYADGLVAFKLDSLPDTNGKTVKLKLKWKSFDGDKSVEFNYCSRKSTPAKASIAAERSALNLK